MPCSAKTPFSVTELRLWLLLTDYEHRAHVEPEEWCSLEVDHGGDHYADVPFDHIANHTEEVLWLRLSDDGAARNIITAAFCGEPCPGVATGDPHCGNPAGHAGAHSWTYDPQGRLLVLPRAMAITAGSTPTSSTRGGAGRLVASVSWLLGSMLPFRSVRSRARSTLVDSPGPTPGPARPAVPSFTSQLR